MKRVLVRLMVLAALAGSLGFFGLSASTAVKADTWCEWGCYDEFDACAANCASESCYWRCESRLARCLYWCNPT